MNTLHKDQASFTLDANGLTPGPWPPAGPPDPAQVARCRAFLELCVHTKTPRVGSYGLKHVIERWAGDYVQAALDLGVGGKALRSRQPQRRHGRLAVQRASNTEGGFPCVT